MHGEKIKVVQKPVTHYKLISRALWRELVIWCDVLRIFNTVLFIS